MAAPKVLIPMADYGHDPTEAAIPYKIFTKAGFDVHFATEHGKSPRCDSKMLCGITGALLGANAEAKKAYHDMIASESNVAGTINKPHAWTSPDFSMSEYDMVFLPGGHDKGVRQIIDSNEMHNLLADYFESTRRSKTSTLLNVPKRSVGAICHGVQVLAFTPSSTSTGKSVIHECKTTALPAIMEESIFRLTRPFLGDYYKTYGYGSKSVQGFVCDALDDPKQFVNSPLVEDETYNYVTGRFPPDAWGLAKRAVEMVKEGMPQ